MSRTKNPVQYQIESLLPSLGIFTIASAAERLTDDGINVGNKCRYLRNAVEEAVAKGSLRVKAHGVYEAPSAKTPSSVPVIPHLGYIPTVDDDFIMPQALVPYLPHIGKGVDRFRFTGPKGTGKTETCLQIAAMLGKPVLVMDCAIVREPRDFFGMRSLEDGRTYWQDSAFTRMVEEGNCVIILDELNRASDMVCNSLLPLLDRRGQSLVQERGRPVKLGPSITWLATMNEGSQYNVNQLDSALMDRFARNIEVSYLESSQEIKLLGKRTRLDVAKCTSLVEIANVTRDPQTGFTTQVSTRQLITAASDLADVGPASLQATIANLFTAEGGAGSERSAISALLVSKFGGTT